MASTEDVIREIERAFADAPRPSEDELLHPDARDDNDLKSLYGVAHRRDLSDEAVEYEYAALFFLGPAGFRHFLPAYIVRPASSRQRCGGGRLDGLRVDAGAR